MAEWSKAFDSSSNLARGVGSNPTAGIFSSQKTKKSTSYMYHRNNWHHKQMESRGAVGQRIGLMSLGSRVRAPPGLNDKYNLGQTL